MAVRVDDARHDEHARRHRSPARRPAAAGRLAPIALILPALDQDVGLVEPGRAWPRSESWRCGSVPGRSSASLGTRSASSSVSYSGAAPARRRSFFGPSFLADSFLPSFFGSSALVRVVFELDPVGEHVPDLRLGLVEVAVGHDQVSGLALVDRRRLGWRRRGCWPPPSVRAFSAADAGKAGRDGLAQVRRGTSRAVCRPSWHESRRRTARRLGATRPRTHLLFP